MPEKLPLLVFAEPGAAAALERCVKQLPDAAILCHERDRESASEFSDTVVAYAGGFLAPCRDDLHDISRRLGRLDRTRAFVPAFERGTPPHVRTALRLLGLTEAWEIGAEGHRALPLPRLPERGAIKILLLKACGGIGNVVLVTPLVSASLGQGWETIFCPISDLDGSSFADLFRLKVEGLRVVRPSELDGLRADVTLNIEAHGLRGTDDFHHNPFRVGISGYEPGFAARFFQNVTGVSVDVSQTFVGGDPHSLPAGLRGRIVVCPGSKSGWDSKRWPHMNDLLRRLDDPVVLCRDDDIAAYRDLDFLSPLTAPGAKIITGMDLFQAASLLRGARAVVANDCGMAHVAAAAGVPTVILFGPSSLEKNRHPGENVRVLSLGLDCQPCQGGDGPHGGLAPNDYFCSHGFRCLADLDVDQVLRALNGVLDQGASL